ncbi:MAG: epimerase, partial [Armatimonadota bacterium]
MTNSDTNVVTGAFGYTGKYIAQRLLAAGKSVKTITGHPQRRSPFRDRVPAEPFNFDAPEALAQSLRGASTLFNTYWIRFPRGELTFEK